VWSCCYDGVSIQNKRNCNMDSLLLKERSVCGQNVYLVVICDGVGSMKDGAVASSMAVHCLGKWLDGVTSLHRIGLCLQDQVLEAHQHIVEEIRVQGLRTASTLSALLLTEGRYYLVHTGDSRIYIWRDGCLEQLTYDQISEGKLTACLGHMDAPLLIYNEGVCCKSKFLLCSDGLYKRMDMEYLRHEMSELKVRHLKRTAKRLIHYVVGRGENDNITLAFVICET
jgi:serine/threonine protein phosphatase PrpC